MASAFEPSASSLSSIDIMNDPIYTPNNHSRRAADAADPDHCRICRSEGTPDEPLYHPCKCSGSIKFVHQDCLMEWLQHSQKKYCELCTYPFTFTKVYDPDMPSKLPTPLFLRQLTRRLFRGIIFWARAGLVVFVWLGCLPWCVRWMWRGWFWMSDGGWWNISSTSQVTRSTASSEQVPSETSTPSGNGILGFLSSPSPAPLASATNGVSEVNHTAVETNKSNTNSFYIDGIFFDHNPFGNATRFRFVNRLLVDVMEGQLLTALIVVSFVIIFLIREWVVQQQPALEGDVLVDQAVGVAERLDLADLAVEVAVAPENPEPNRRWGNANGAAAEAGEDSASGLDGPMPVHIGQTPAETDDENDDRPGLMEIGSDSPQQHRRFARPRTRRRLPAQEPASDGALAQGQRPEADDIDERNYSWSESSTSMPFPQRPTSTRENTAQVANLRRDLEEITRYAGTPGYGFGGDGGTFQFTWDSSGSSSQSDMRSRQHPNSTISDGSEANPSEWPKDNISLSRPISFAAAEHTASDTGRRPSRNYNEGDANGSGITTWEPSSLADIDSSYGPGKTFDQSPFTYDGTESEGKGKGKERPHFDDNIESVLESEGEDESIPGGSRGIGASEWSTIASPPTPPPLNQAVAQVDGGARGNENELQEHRLPRHNVLLNTALRHAANHETEGALARPIFDHDIPPQQNLDELNQRNIDVGDVDEDVEGPVAGVPPVMVDDDGADDFEGIMELVGMRGPLLGLVQNAAISNMLITATVATGVAFPYVTGKTVMMILAHPILFCFKIPSMAVSFCAEFLVDSATVFVFSVLLMFDQLIRFFARPASYFLPILGRYLSSSSITNFLRNWASDGQTRVFAKFTTIETAYMAIRRLPPSAVPPLSIVVKESWERFSISICWVLEKMGLAGLTSASISAGPHELDLKLFKMSNPLSIVAQVWEDTFAAVNHTWTTNSTTGPGEAVLLNSLHLAPYGAYPWSAWDRVGVVLLGYAFFTVAGMIYVNRRRRGQVGNIERTATEFLQQCGGVMKVVLIIGIEMFVFPLYCGILLDIAMLPLFETATITSRVQFALDFPITNVFVHWFVGTCYMFHFALFVSMCRKIMRTGVLYFIRDPDDPTFHPVRDVLNRPVVTQLRKIGFSAFIYGVLVLLCLGGVVWGLHGATENVLPIHWSSNEPVLEFPVDLLFYNFLMPIAVKVVKPSDALQTIYSWWFKVCARTLRLSSFMFGERKKDEEGYTQHPTWWSLLMLEKADPEDPVLPGEFGPKDKVYFQRTGRFVRAPASDSVRRPKDAPVFIPVDESNNRLDVDSSNDDPDGPTGARNPDWSLVYIPPYFKLRIAMVVFGIWIFAAVTGVAVTIGPMLLGRAILRQLVPPHVRLNDIYAFSVGIYILGGSYLGLSRAPALFRLMKAILRPVAIAASNAATYSEKIRNVWHAALEVALRTAKISYVITAFAIVIPTLVALIIEFYVIIPLHTAFGEQASVVASAAQATVGLNNNTPTPDTVVNTPRVQAAQIGHTVHFVQDWTLGVLYVKMMAKMMMLDDTSIWARSLRGIIQQGWLNPDARLATEIFIAPGVGGMVLALVLPLILAKFAIVLGVGEEVLVYRYAFPAVLAGALLVGIAYGVWRIVEGWKDKVRDEVYLRGVRVHNHGEDAPPRRSSVAMIARPR